MIYFFLNQFHNTECAVRIPERLTRDTQRETYQAIEKSACLGNPTSHRQIQKIRRTLCPSGGYPNCMCGIVRNERND